MSIETRELGADPLRHRAVSARRAQLRHLFAPAERPHHLSGRADRRPCGQLGGGAAAAPGKRRSRKGHLPLHQFPRRLGHGRPGHPGHHELHQVRRVHHLHRRVRLHGGRAAFRRHAKGKRFCLPNSMVLIHQPSGGAQGQQTEIAIVADFMLKTRQRLNKILADNTGQTLRDHPAGHGARQLHDRRRGEGLRPGGRHHFPSRRRAGRAETGE